jgi:hypothetical protein
MNHCPVRRASCASDTYCAVSPPSDHFHLPSAIDCQQDTRCVTRIVIDTDSCVLYQLDQHFPSIVGYEKGWNGNIHLSFSTLCHDDTPAHLS